MKNNWPLVAVGIAAFVIFALVTLPARVVIPRVQPEGLTLAGLDGSIWNGSAEAMQVGGVHIGSLTWKLNPLSLLTMQVAADIKLKRTDGFAQGGVRLGKDRVQLNDFSASLPFSVLPAQVVPRGWTGTINARLSELTLVDQWPVSANGTIDLVNLSRVTDRPVNMGSYRATFPQETNDVGTLVGSIEDVEGVVQIAGKIALKAADRSYVVDGLVSAKPDAPSDVTRTLEFLGPPDAQGRRQVSLAGTM
jgi:general secretion pathway protein N